MIAPPNMNVLKLVVSPYWSDPKVPIVTQLVWYLGVHKRSLNRLNQEKQGSVSVRFVFSFKLVPRSS
jgi:hypothetical protein